jgi:hypothetical protein
VNAAFQVRRGITRTVYLTRLWAIKTPSLRSHGTGVAGMLWSLCRGVLANLSEREWSGSPGTCPMRWSLAGLVNVYPRCEHVTEDLSDAEYEAIGFLGPADKNPHNVGVLDGRLVWVDYDMSWNDRPPCHTR